MKRAIAFLLTLIMVMCVTPLVCADSEFEPNLDSIYPRTYFGHYEQDGIITNGAEPIEWYVLDNQDGDCLLLSKHILDARAFNERNTESYLVNSSKEEVKWESCSLRNWLNEEFYEGAFSGAEQDSIDATITHEQNNHDTIFLFSYEEAERYLPEYQNRVALPTKNAVNNNLAISTVNGAGGWWIRSAARDAGNAANISPIGRKGEYLAANVTFGVRPGVWVAADSLDILYGEEDYSSEEIEEHNYDEVGSTVILGHYEQDGDLANGSESIQWIVLDSHDGKSLLLSKYLLDYQPYNTLFTYSQWSTSSIHSWLNEQFLYTAFSDEEICTILPVQIHDDSDSLSGIYSFTDGENSDYLFLLNRYEAEEYFESHRDRTVRVTTVIDLLNGINQKRKEIADSVKTINPDLEINDYDSWWLRDNTDMSVYAPAVKENGDIYPTNNVTDKAGIRPALWVDLNTLPVS